MEMHVNDQNGQINSLTPSEWNSMYVLRMARTKTAVICRRPDPTTKAEPFWKTDRRRQKGEKESTFGQYINRENVTSKRWLTSSRLTLRLKYLKPTGANHNWQTLTMWLNHNEPDDRWWQKIRLMTTITSLPEGKCYRSIFNVEEERDWHEWALRCANLVQMDEAELVERCTIFFKQLKTRCGRKCQHVWLCKFQFKQQLSWGRHPPFFWTTGENGLI